MGTTTITGKDTLTLWDKVFNDFADGDASILTHPNELIAMKTGKNGNSIYTKNETGNNGELVLRLVRGSSDDRFLNGKLAEVQGDDFASLTLAEGSLIKRLGDGDGNVFSDTYNLQGGIISRMVDTKENVEGDIEPAVSTYTMKIAVSKRNIG